MNLDPFLRLPEVLRVTGLSRSSVYKRISAGNFPRPIKLGERAAAWRQSQIARWQAEREAGAAPANAVIGALATGQ